MPNLSQKLLDMRDTYVVQLFGDITVREILAETCPRRVLRSNDCHFKVVTDGQQGVHHCLQHNKTGKIMCSKKTGLQNIREDPDDNLCQLYSLCRYFGLHLPDHTTKKQLLIIDFVRNLCQHPQFLEKLETEVLTHRKNTGLWKIYRSGCQTSQNCPMNRTKLEASLIETLDLWEREIVSG